MVSLNYEPIQIPFILNETFKKAYHYKEVFVSELSDFVICMWTMEGVKGLNEFQFENVIVPDGCIDLVVDFTHRKIIFSGMSAITYDVVETSNDQYFGFRMKPGALRAVFGIDPRLAMDKTLVFPNLHGMFEKDFQHAQQLMLNHLKTLEFEVSDAMNLFDTLYAMDTINSVEAISQLLSMSVRQTQRYFINNFGIGPKLILDVIRFQKSLRYLLAQDEVSMVELALSSGYYDQAHFSKDMKKNMGISPRALIGQYQTIDRNIQEP